MIGELWQRSFVATFGGPFLPEASSRWYITRLRRQPIRHAGTGVHSPALKKTYDSPFHQCRGIGSSWGHLRVALGHLGAILEPATRSRPKKKWRAFPPSEKETTRYEFIQHTASGVFEHFRLSNFQTLSPGLIPATPPAATTTTRRTTFSVDATTRQIASPHVRSPIRTVTTTRRTTTTTTTTTTTFPWMRLRGQWLVRM